MTVLWVAAGIVVAAAVGWGIRRARQRNVFLWLPSYLRGNWAGKRERALARGKPVHVIFCVADHFEPAVQDPGPDGQRGRLDAWIQRYPRMAEPFRDADGRPPRHTFFYPAEQYRPEHLDRLGVLVSTGYGEVEVHLHHDRDTSDGLRRTLQEFVERLGGHGHLGADMRDGRKRFAFVHGNWALDNSHPEGRWCGVSDELRVLRECGCYADFTLPSAPSPTQTRRINSIYYADDDPERAKSHDDGVEVRAGAHPSGDLMIVQGPLTVLWPGGKGWVLPRLENAGLTGVATPAAPRVDAWINTRVCVAGRPDWVFVKVHTHGCLDRNLDILLGDPMRHLHERLCGYYNDGSQFRLHYVTAREMYNIIKAAERGLSGDPGEFRDLEIAPPPLASASRPARGT